MPTGSIPALLSSEAGDREKLAAILAQEEFRGSIVNGISNLGNEAQAKLREAYPKVDFSKVWVLAEGRYAWSGAVSHLAFALGLALGMWWCMAFHRTEFHGG
ncbi:MAG: hypothetical protein K2W96_18095 [Gemmataceae bacterium]|nr:hypothetical protein [Gemmataceae bacterium]